MRRYRIYVCFMFLAVMPGVANSDPSTTTWVHDSFEDFVAGRLDASGQNIYVARDGTVRTIHRFDLNQDGYLDLLFNSTHDDRTYIPATLCTVAGNENIKQEPLAVLGSKRVEVADLNLDGYPDLIFCPNPSGIQTSRQFLTIIWGGEDGWPAQRSNGQLPVNNPVALGVVDLNHDGWPDIAVLNYSNAWLRGQPEGLIIRVFWGSADGFLLPHRQDFGVPLAQDLAAGDFDGDGARDLAVLAGDSRIHIFWSQSAGQTSDQPDTSTVELPDPDLTCMITADVNKDGQLDLVVSRPKGKTYILSGQEGRTWTDPVEVPDLGASYLLVADLDNDGYQDLVLTSLETGHAAGGEQAAATDRSVLRIVWGSEAGFSILRSTIMIIPCEYPSAIAAGDLNGDGQLDLAVAIFQGQNTYEGESLVFFNRGSKEFERCGQTVQTAGAADVAIIPADKGQPGRAIFCNNVGGTLNEVTPLDVYWGGPHGFDSQRHLEIPFQSGYEASAADLNADGCVDLIAMNSGHGGQQNNPTLGANIFWGGNKGLDLTNPRTVLKEDSLWSSNIADLNHDGYLDLILGSFASNADSAVVIRYGSQDGFNQRLALTLGAASMGCTVADFNCDGWLDIVVSSITSKDCLTIFWGSSGGFDATRQSRLMMPTPAAIETADLNGDGWLDLIVGSYYDPIEKHFDTGVLIFWGSAGGFKQWNAQWLPGMGTCGLTVADFDGDGYLDLFAANYHGDLMRESIPSYLYWGSREGFLASRKTNLICDSAHDAMAGDFDHDGLLDLAVSCHTRHGDHHTNSKVFYNDGHRFQNPRVTNLPTHGTHWMYDQDVGHVYDRRFSQTYESVVLHWDGPGKSGTLTCEAETPERTELAFAVRAAVDEADLSKANWDPCEPEKNFTLKETARYIQYQVIFKSDNGDRYPVLDKVSIILQH